jgi:hypothetical protein
VLASKKSRDDIVHSRHPRMRQETIMTTDNRQQVAQPQVEITSMAVLATHVIWLFFGPSFLMLLLLAMAQSATGWFSGLDFAYFAIVGLMVFARWFEQRSGQAVTVMGEVSLWRHFRLYAISLPLTAGALWILANVIGNYIVGGIAGR